MVAVAGLVVEVLDDGVEGRLLDDAGGVPTRTTQFRLLATAAFGTPEGEAPQNARNDEQTHLSQKVLRSRTCSKCEVLQDEPLAGATRSRMSRRMRWKRVFWRGVGTLRVVGSAQPLLMPPRTRSRR